MATVRFKDATRHYPGNPKQTIATDNINTTAELDIVFEHAARSEA